MKKLWAYEALNDYVDWQSHDKKTLKKINQLLKDIDCNGYTGIGKPEPLKYDLQGFWSRKIDGENRLVYRIEDEQIEIAQCKTHYEK
ncbi:Txe/YoeB family addiction module toxin [Clostridium estertheticum]|uniref:Endoribonuclease YoeB n=1 Tax=Clostridium estertheticum TaxID=238834 RepID=A0A7Y3WUE0_9CLOT|nr:Txe/YoeB family addiction module toxin [Clostridium estertheticum]NNU78076.1 Txe/YoeB family addiction module toxin [Clostridium estertheticum]WBL49509.1 Txe/YoeB family addiction module toxin [Clostridium estertheticum]